MAEANSIIENGQKDLKTIEDFVNLPAGSEVNPRLLPSVDVGTLSGIRDAIFEAGGLPAKPFPTKAVMESEGASLADGTLAQVYNETTNNGLYVKTAGAWVKSAYDPLTQANTYTDASATIALSTMQQEVSKLIKIETVGQAKNLVDFVDGVGSTYASFDEKAGLMLSAMPPHIANKSVQQALEATPVKANTNSQDIFSVVDAEDNVVARIASDSHFHLPFLDKSLQYSLETVLPIPSNRRLHEKEFFTDAVFKYANQLTCTSNKHAPMPLGLLPSNFNVPDSIINDLHDVGEHTAIKLDSPYLRHDDFVHPSIIELPNAVRGYRYLLLINPFSVEYWENPVVYGSNNLVDFDLLEGFHQPIAHAEHDNTDYRSFLSDSCWSYDPVRGEIMVMWRSSYWPTGAPLADVLTDYRHSRTKDLLNWTDEEIYIPAKPESEEMRRSPSVLFNPNDGLWYMFSSPDVGKFEVRTAKQLHDTWSQPTNIPMTNATRTWHQEVKYVGGKFVALFDNRDAGRLFFGISTDGINWNISTTPVFADDISSLYKASFVPELSADGNSLFFHIFYTWYDRTRKPMNLMHVKTNSITI